MLLKVLGLDVDLVCHIYFHLKVVLLLLVGPDLEDYLRLTKTMETPRRRAQLGRCLLVPCIRFRGPNHGARELHSVAVVDHVLPGLLAACITKGKQPRTEWPRPHAVVG